MNYFKTLLILALFTIGIGLIVNGVQNTNASNQQPELLELPSIENILPEVSNDVVTDTDYEDVLMQLHTGQWFGFLDIDNKTYENIIIHDNTKSLPSKAVLDAMILSENNRRTDKSNRRTISRSNKVILENRFTSDNYTLDDVVEYLRLLGDF